MHIKYVKKIYNGERRSSNPINKFLQLPDVIRFYTLIQESANKKKFVHLLEKRFKRPISVFMVPPLSPVVYANLLFYLLIQADILLTGICGISQLLNLERFNKTLILPIRRKGVLVNTKLYITYMYFSKLYGAALVQIEEAEVPKQFCFLTRTNTLKKVNEVE